MAGSLGTPTKRKTRSRSNGEGSVFKRIRYNKIRWYAELVIGWENGKKRVLRSPAFEKKEQASAWLAERLAERNKNTLVEPSRVTVGSHVESWLEHTASLEVGPSTLRLYRNVYKWYIEPALGKVPLQQLTPQQIQTLCHNLVSGKGRDKPVSPRTVQLMLTVLRRSLRQAVQWNLIPRNPVGSVTAPKIEKRQMTVLDEDQFARFIEAAKKERLHALFILAVTTGLRQGELLALRWDDVDLQTGTITVRRTRKIVLDENGKDKAVVGKPKTESAVRTIPLASVALESLKRWKREQFEELQELGLLRPFDNLVFTSRANTPLHPRNIRDDGFRRICEAIGMTERRPRQKRAKDGSITRSVPLLRFHDLRHTAFTFMLSQGVKPEVVQKIAGHSDITTTLRIYRHVFEEEKKEAAQVVDDFLTAAARRG